MILHLALAGFERALRGTVEFALDHPLDWMDWTRRQWQFLELLEAELCALFRAGNQVGKTIVGAGSTIAACLGYDIATGRARPVPIEAWVVCTSWSQAVAIMSKVWALVPKDALAPGTRFNLRTGFGKDTPAIVFRNGSVLRFKTTGQGAEALAGATVDWVWIDEPTDLDIFRELQKRVLRRRGKLILTLTPVNRPCEWLHELVEAGVIREVHAPMDADSLTFRKSGQRMRLLDDTPMDDAWIAEQRRITPSMFVPVVIDGEWETRPEGVFFTCFEEAKHVSALVRFRGNDKVKLRWYLGIDYAAADREFGQVAVLCRVMDSPRAGTNEHDYWVYVVDEVVMNGVADSEEFAEELVGMLARQGIGWHDISLAHGDNPVTSRWEEKSNLNTMKAVAGRLRIPQKALRPRILNAKDGVRSSGSRDTGCRWLYSHLAKGRVMIHPRCTHLIKGMLTWDFGRDHTHCDVIDALRYALKRVVFPHGGTGHVTLRVAA